MHGAAGEVLDLLKRAKVDVETRAWPATYWLGRERRHFDADGAPAELRAAHDAFDAALRDDDTAWAERRPLYVELHQALLADAYEANMLAPSTDDDDFDGPRATTFITPPPGLKLTRISEQCLRRLFALLSLACGRSALGRPSLEVAE